MSYKHTLVKFALKQSPKKMILWIANKKTKGVVKLTDFSFNSVERTLYAQLVFAGEQDAVDLWIEDFTLITKEESFRIVVHQAQSNRPWVDNLLTHFVLNRELRIPDKHADLIHKFMAYEGPEQAENDE